MDDEAADGGQRRHFVNQDHQPPHPAYPDGNVLREPQEDARKQQHQRAVKHQPIEQFLAAVEAILRRDQIVMVGDVILRLVQPAFIDLGDIHVAAPQIVHPYRACDKQQAAHRMPESRSGAAAQHQRDPEKMRRVECQSGRQTIRIGQRGYPVTQPFRELIAQNTSGGNGFRSHQDAAHFTSSCLCWPLSSSTFFGPKRT